VKIEFDCAIYNEANELLTTATFILVFVALKTGRPTAPPEYILDIFKTLDEKC
jgi:acyl-CoA thioester hydrolase